MAAGSPKPEGEFFSKGSPELVAARRRLLALSLRAAEDRVAAHKRAFAAGPEARRAAHSAAAAPWLRSRCTEAVLLPVSEARAVSAALPPTSVAVAAGSRLVVTGGEDATVAWWSAAGGLLSVGVGHELRVNDVAACRSGGALCASAGNDRAVRLWAAPEAEAPVAGAPPTVAPRATLTGHTGRVARVALFHGLAASVSDDHTWRLWDAEAAAQLAAHDAHHAPVTAVDAHPDASLLATADRTGVALLWDLRSGRCVAQARSHDETCTAVRFSPTGRVLATGGGDGTLRLWDMRRTEPKSNRLRCLATAAAHSDWVSAVDFDAGGDVAFTSGLDGTVAVWDGWCGALLVRHRLGAGPIRRLAFAAGDAEVGPFVVAACRTQKSWNVIRRDPTGDEARTITTAPIGAVSAAPAAAAGDGEDTPVAESSSSDDDLAGLRA